MAKPKLPRGNDTAAQKSNGAKHAKAPPIPPVPDGYWRAPTDPLWWRGTHERELHGALVDQEVTASPDGKLVNALVVWVTQPVHATNNRGEVVVVAKDSTVRVDAPELQKLAVFANHPAQVLPIIVHRIDHDGRTWFVADVGKEGLPRDQFTPKVQPPALDPPS